MSRTYRFRHDTWQAKYRREWDNSPKYQNNMPDGTNILFSSFSSRMKWHTNFWRRADARRYEAEAMSFGDCQFSENEKKYKMLHWVYD
jgi:hypothetical protein